MPVPGSNSSTAKSGVPGKGKPKQTAVQKTGGVLKNIGKTALQTLSRPGQAVLHVMENQAALSDRTRADTAPGLAARISPEHLLESARAGAKALADIDGSDNINLRQAMGNTKDAGGVAGTIIDLVGSTAVDPTMFFGVGGLGKAGRIAEDGYKAIAVHHGAELADKARALGVSRLSAAEQSAVRGALANSDNAARAAGDRGLSAVARQAQGKTIRSGGEKYVERLVGREGKSFEAGALLQPQGAKFAGATILTKETADRIANQVGLGKLARATKASKGGRVFAGAFKPRAAVGAAHGDEAAQTLGDLQARARGVEANAADNVIRAVQNAVKGGNVNKAQMTHIANSLEKGDQAVAKAARGFDRSGNKHAANLLRVLDNARRDASAVAARGVDRPGEAVGLRVPSLSFRRALETRPEEVIGKLGLSPEAGAALLRDPMGALGKVDPGLTAAQINDKYKAILGVEDVLEADAITTTLQAVQQAYRSEGTRGLVEGLLRSTDEAGKPLMTALKGEDVPLGYVKVTTKAGDFAAPPAIAKEVGNSMRMLADDEALTMLGQLTKDWTTLWRTQATSSLLLGTGYQLRNTYGNLFNMWLKGFDNPRLLGEAAKVQRAMSKASEGGKPFDEALKAAKLAPRYKRMLKSAYDDGVIGGSQFRVDLPNAGIAVNRAQRVKTALNPFSADNIITGNRPGRFIAQTIEDNNRLAMYMWDFNRTGSRVSARRTVKETMFDYGDLTGAEKWIKNSAMPFYTWQRKNIGLQSWALANAPGKTAVVQRLHDEIAASGPDLTGQTIPGFAQDKGETGLFSLGNVPVIGTVQSPIEAAAMQFQPLADLARGITGTDPNGVQKGAAGIGNQVSGPIGGVGKQILSEGAGVNLFTGAPNEAGRGAALGRLAGAASPLEGRIAGALKNSPAGVPGSKDRSPEERRAYLLQQLSGLTLTPLTEDVQKSAALRTKAEGSKIKNAQANKKKKAAKKAQDKK